MARTRTSIVGLIASLSLIGGRLPSVQDTAPRTESAAASRVRCSGGYPSAVTVNSFGRLPASTISAAPKSFVSAFPPAGVAGGEIGGPNTSRGGINTFPPVHRTAACGTGRPDCESRTSIRAPSGEDPARHPCRANTLPTATIVRPIVLICCVNAFLLYR